MDKIEDAEDEIQTYLTDTDRIKGEYRNKIVGGERMIQATARQQYERHGLQGVDMEQYNKSIVYTVLNSPDVNCAVRYVDTIKVLYIAYKVQVPIPQQPSEYPHNIVFFTSAIRQQLTNLSIYKLSPAQIVVNNQDSMNTKKYNEVVRAEVREMCQEYIQHIQPLVKIP